MISARLDLLVVLALCTLTVASEASAFELKRDSSGEPVRWTTAVEFVISDRASKILGDERASEALAAAFETFRAAVPALEIGYREAHTHDKARYEASGKPNENQIVFPGDWEHDDDYLAVTIVTIDRVSHRIVDADIELNVAPRRFHSNRGAAPDANAYDLQAVLTHELGHALGLAHNSTDEHAVMFPYLVQGDATKRVLTDDDLAGLAVLYEELSAVAVEQAAGCAAAASEGPGWVLLSIAPVLWFARRSKRASGARAGGKAARRWVSAGALVAPLLATAASPRPVPQLDEAELVATGEVSSTRSLPPDERGRLFTEVVVRVRACVKGECPKELVTRVRGGVHGDLEQVVEGQSVPRRGDSLGVALRPTAAGAGKSSGASAVARHRASVFRLDEAGDFLAFAAGLRKAGLRVNLPTPRTSWVPTTPRGQP